MYIALHKSLADSETTNMYMGDSRAWRKVKTEIDLKIAGPFNVLLYLHKIVILKDYQNLTGV